MGELALFVEDAAPQAFALLADDAHRGGCRRRVGDLRMLDDEAIERPGGSGAGGGDQAEGARQDGAAADAVGGDTGPPGVVVGHAFRFPSPAVWGL